MTTAAVPIVTPAHANHARNLQGRLHLGRHRRWWPMRRAAAGLLDLYLTPDSSLAILGAGNGDTLPLRRLARSTARLALVDLDADALRHARRRCRPHHRQITTVPEDVTGGAADAVVAAATTGGTGHVQAPRTPLPGAPYDVVVIDLLLTQLLYPALLDSGLPSSRIDDALACHGQQLTDAVIARAVASAPDGVVVVLHDVLGWWPGRTQPAPLRDVLAAARRNTDDALALIAQGQQPAGCDVAGACARAGLAILDTRFWAWPFTPGSQYLVHATVAAADVAMG